MSVVKMKLCVSQTLHGDITSQRGKAREILVTAKRLCRETPSLDSDPVLHDKMDDLERQSNSCAKLSADRQTVLEQALPLTADFSDATDELSVGLDKLEDEISQPEPPTVTAEQIREQQEKIKVSKYCVLSLFIFMLNSYRIF